MHRKKDFPEYLVADLERASEVWLFGVHVTGAMRYHRTTLEQKLEADFRRYIILGACNPPLAHKALSAQLNIGLLLPCNVIVYEEDEGSVVEILDPIKMLDIAGNPEVEPVAEEARARLERVAGSLAAAG